MPRPESDALSAVSDADNSVLDSSVVGRFGRRIIPENEDIQMNLIAIAIGVIAGLGAVVFRLTIWAFQEMFFGTNLNPGNVEYPLIPSPNLFTLFAVLGDWRFVLLPAIGGLFVGLIIHFTTPEVSGHGVPKVLESMLVRGGRINPKISVYKTLASSVAIASGGSLGREGPIIQIGSAAGSFFGRFIDAKHTRTLVAAGAAAGIAGTFNAPIAGIMFALEILLAEYYLRHVITVVLSAVMATAIARPLLQFTPNPGVRAFLVPVSYQMYLPGIELPLYMLLGIVIAVVGAFCVKLLYGVEHVFERLDVPTFTKPAIGGALLGVSVLIAANRFGVSGHQSATWLLGVGYDTIHASMTGELGIGLLVGLALLKALGFSLSVGSGSSGGVFSPTLYIGAMVGGAFGLLVHSLFPGTATAGAYALVGMAGVFAATARAPLTATLIIFELTGQYTVILPLLVVTVLGSEVTHLLLDGGTIYTEKLRERGITVQERRIGSLESLTAKDVMTTSVDTLSVGSTVADALELFQATSHHGIPIVDEEGRLAGIIVLSDLQKVIGDHVKASLHNGELAQELDVPVEEVGTTRVTSARAETNLLNIVDLMEIAEVGRVPIINSDRVLVGIVSRSDILDAYDDIPMKVRDSNKRLNGIGTEHNL